MFPFLWSKIRLHGREMLLRTNYLLYTNSLSKEENLLKTESHARGTREVLRVTFYACSSCKFNIPTLWSNGIVIDMKVGSLPLTVKVYLNVLLMVFCLLCVHVSSDEGQILK